MLLRPIPEIAADLGLLASEVEAYGRFKAKISLAALDRLHHRPPGKLVLVTAVSPTRAGEGKTTVSIGLAQGLNRLGVRAVATLREPSLGPVFGLKGGGTGGGKARVEPSDEINLHFTGDLHAIAAANNLLAAVIDNHLQGENPLALEPRSVTWKRCLDLNDRALRHVVTGLGGSANGIPRETGFDVTAASEIMAVLCLSASREDLSARLARLVVGTDREGRPVAAEGLGITGAVAALLQDALQPNLVQTSEGTPALVHGGPFGNIAHGCSSVLATRLALQLGEVCVTEAGFGADLGAEKFMNIKARQSGLWPDVAVLVATVRALKLQGGAPAGSLEREDLEALHAGFCNLERHAENLRKFGLPVVVALNRFAADTEAELNAVKQRCERIGLPYAPADVWAAGGAGAEDLARATLAALEMPGRAHVLYPDDLSLRGKVEAVAKEIYRAGAVDFSPEAAARLEGLEAGSFRRLPVCIAKTQYSFTDDPTRLGAPTGHTLTVRDLRLAAGAGFVVAYAGTVSTMPGLPRHPNAERITVSPDGEIHGIA